MHEFLMQIENLMLDENLMLESGVAFGTSGARGLVSAMTDQVCYAYTSVFLEHLESLGEFSPKTEVVLSGDLFPSTPQILKACAAAIEDAGGVQLFCDYLPSPAVALQSFSRGIPSLMVKCKVSILVNELPARYTSADFTKLLKDHHIKISMDGRSAGGTRSLSSASGAVSSTKRSIYTPTTVSLRPRGLASTSRSTTSAGRTATSTAYRRIKPTLLICRISGQQHELSSVTHRTLAFRHRGAGGGVVDNRHPKGSTYLQPISVQSNGATSVNGRKSPVFQRLYDSTPQHDGVQRIFNRPLKNPAHCMRMV